LKPDASRRRRLQRIREGEGWTHQQGSDSEELIVLLAVLDDGLLDGPVEEVQLAGLEEALHLVEVLLLEVARAVLLRVLAQDVACGVESTGVRVSG
jgi:hypothetical protein